MSGNSSTEANSTGELLREIGIAEATAGTAMRKAKAYINYQRSVIADLIQYLPKDHPYQPGFQEAAAGGLCEDCPPVGYPTDKTRCDPCPRSSGEPEYAEPLAWWHPNYGVVAKLDHSRIEMQGWKPLYLRSSPNGRGES